MPGLSYSVVCGLLQEAYEVIGFLDDDAGQAA
jgi:hypothetical protein